MELTTTHSLQSVTRSAVVTEQPTRLSRWWMRHYRHIGLASTAGSAILVFIIGVVLLPIIFHNSSKDDEFPCVTITYLSPKPTTTSTETTINTNSSFSIIPVNLLCAVNTVWKNQAITIADSFNITNSSSRTYLSYPNDMLIDEYQNLFIADTNNHRVVYWPMNATESRIVAGTGVFGSWINLLKYPAAIVAWNDQLYVSDLDNYRILSFPLSTTEDSPDGTTIVGFEGAGSTINQISYIYSMAIDRIRQIFYLSDFQNHRILKLNLLNNKLQSIIGTGISDSNNTSLNFPLGITIDEATGSLYVTDSRNHRIQKFEFNSTQGITVAGGINYGQNLSQLYLPSNVALDSTCNVYIADSGNHRIVQWLVGARQGRIIAGTGIAGMSNTQLNNPVQLKFDIHYNLYIVDKNNSRIQRFDLLYNGC